MGSDWSFQARVVKAGGIVFLTTDLVMTGQATLLGNGWNKRQVEQAVLAPAKAARLELVEPIHWGVSPLSLKLGFNGGTYGHAWQCGDATPQLHPCAYLPQEKSYSCWASLALTFRK